MNVETVTSLAQFAALAPEWDRLAAHVDTPLMRHDWLLSCAEAFHADGELTVLTVRDVSGLHAAVPLTRSRERGGDYRMLGGARLGEPCAVLYDSVEALQALCQALAALRQPLLLARLQRDRNVRAGLRAAFAGHGMLLTRRASGAPFLTAAGSWPQFLESRSARRRADLRRARKLLEQSGSVSVEFLAPAVSNVGECLKNAFAIEASGWKGRRGSAMALDPALDAFMRRFAVRAAAAGLLRVGFLKVAGRAVAMHIGVDWAQRHWVLKIGYDEAWSRASPGLQLMHEVVRRVFDSNLRGCEFLGSPEPWIKIWTRRLHPCRSYRYYPWSVLGAYSVVADIAGALAQRLKQRRRAIT